MREVKDWILESDLRREMNEDSADVHQESAVSCGQWRLQATDPKPGSRTHCAQGVTVKLVLYAGHNAEVACLPHPRYRMIFHEIHVPDRKTPRMLL
jgi:hypothetical protein